MGAWNVRTMNQPRKLANIEREFKRLYMNVLEVTEVKWTGTGEKPTLDGGSYIYSG